MGSSCEIENVCPHWIKGNPHPPPTPLHPLFNPDAGSRTLVSKQLHMFVCLFLISFMKTKISVVLTQGRCDLPMPQGSFVFGAFGFWESCNRSSIRIYACVSGYDVAPASVQIFRQVHFNTNKLNIVYVGKKCVVELCDPF